MILHFILQFVPTVFCVCTPTGDTKHKLGSLWVTWVCWKPRRCWILLYEAYELKWMVEPGQTTHCKTGTKFGPNVARNFQITHSWLIGSIYNIPNPHFPLQSISLMKLDVVTKTEPVDLQVITQNTKLLVYAVQSNACILGDRIVDIDHSMCYWCRVSRFLVFWTKNWTKHTNTAKKEWSNKSRDLLKTKVHSTGW